jgi:Xaa-Pro aminopeptidase
MIKAKIARLRKLFQRHKINGYIVPTTDEYLSEYPPDCAKRLEYITGFSGSYGMAIILENTVLFFTDGRYLTISREQLDPEDFNIFDISALYDFDWKNYVSDGDIIAYDPKLFTERVLHNFNKLELRSLLPNIIDEIWTDRPDKPNSKIYEYPVKYAGLDYKDKLTKCRDFISDTYAKALVVTNSDSVCWILNIRAHDAPFSPLLLANMIVTEKEVFLFTDISRFEKGTLEIRSDISILPETDFQSKIEEFTGIILFDSSLCSSYITNLIKGKKHKEIKDPIQLQKACKNKIEIEFMIKGHVQDAIAVCEFLAMIASSDVTTLSEYDLGKELTSYRAKRNGYVMDSFPSICGYMDNGAIIHYRAEKSGAKKITDSGLLLIDSGGQYWGATTDITRTITIGKPLDKHKYFYTKVLKGHIALASVVFPEKKVTGGNLDILARQFLWQDGKDYAHGTGHGVGSFLSVHEGPQNISLSSNATKIAIGMIVSNEPGYYVPGEFGIRIENMMYVKNSAMPNYLQFEMLTLVPYAKALIDTSLLTKEEVAYLQGYYRKIEEQIYPLVGNTARTWLEKEISWIYSDF